MKQALILLLLMAGVAAVAQDKSTITVKSSVVVSEVVVVTATQANVADKSKAFELRCNKGPSSCKAPEPGTYQMVRLPKNWGMYDCSNVDLYAASADPATDQKIGEYCLIEK